MSKNSLAQLRNIGIIAHIDAGKTTLTERILFYTRSTHKMGDVDDGTTVTDYDEEEISRKHTLSAALAYAEWNKTKINLIDTPGMANFLSDAKAALRVADAAPGIAEHVPHEQRPHGAIRPRTARRASRAPRSP